jgi:hypothetical protein
LHWPGLRWAVLHCTEAVPGLGYAALGLRWGARLRWVGAALRLGRGSAEAGCSRAALEWAALVLRCARAVLRLGCGWAVLAALSCAGLGLH